MFRHALLPSIALLLIFSRAEAAGAEIVELRKIWDAGRHNAFTDLIRFGDGWLCTFREASVHGNAADGKVRVIVSPDGGRWESAALLESNDGDLRDPKVARMPDGRLMMDVVLAYATPQEGLHHQSKTFFSRDGKSWDGPHGKGDDNFWLWRSTWHKGKCYAVGYPTGPSRAERRTRLYRSGDGRAFQTHVAELCEDRGTSEATLLFRRDDSCICLLRHETAARLGVAQPPYTDWQWKTLNLRLGGPNLIELRDGRLLAAGRVYQPQQHTALLWLDAEKGELTPLLKLPSGGDTSYPGLVLHEGLLWVSYYSSHEGKSNIYLAKVRIE